MLTLAAIDVGSNGIRLAIGVPDGDHGIREIRNAREAVRLGQDVFTQGIISEEAIDRAILAFRKFKRLMDRHAVRRSRAVATSAVREALNRQVFVEQAAQASGLRIEVIEGDEEAKLIHRAVVDRLDLDGERAVMVDIGGGSVEITLSAGGEFEGTRSLGLGTVRLLHMMQDRRIGVAHYAHLVQESVDGAREWIRRRGGGRVPKTVVGTGGNVESLGDLRRQVLGRKGGDRIGRGELETLTRRLQALPLGRRMRDLGLRPDRADVIVPASIVLQAVLREMGAEEILIPRVGLKEGVLLQLAAGERQGRDATRRSTALAAARAMGKKYQYDEAHGDRVASYALKLFDGTRRLHGMDADARLLLEAAALLHDIGRFVHSDGHHKHSYYLIRAQPLAGLTPREQEIVANVARYHRRSPPTVDHEPFRNLSDADRDEVTRLAALLRIADGLDAHHTGLVKDFVLELKDSRCVLRLCGEEDLLVEKWSVIQKAELFEKAFGLKFRIEEQDGRAS